RAAPRPAPAGPVLGPAQAPVRAAPVGSKGALEPVGSKGALEDEGEQEADGADAGHDEPIGEELPLLPAADAGAGSQAEVGHPHSQQREQKEPAHGLSPFRDAWLRAA